MRAYIGNYMLNQGHFAVMILFASLFYYDALYTNNTHNQTKLLLLLSLKVVIIIFQMNGFRDGLSCKMGR